MWTNAQRDGHRAEHRWCPLLNAAVWLAPTARMPCSNEAKTRNPLKFAGSKLIRSWLELKFGLSSSLLAGKHHIYL